MDTSDFNHRTDLTSINFKSSKASERMLKNLLDSVVIASSQEKLQVQVW